MSNQTVDGCLKIQDKCRSDRRNWIIAFITAFVAIGLATASSWANARERLSALEASSTMGQEQLRRLETKIDRTNELILNLTRDVDARRSKQGGTP